MSDYRDTIISGRIPIVEVLGRYIQALEDRDADAIAALFPPDGQFLNYDRASAREFAPRGAGINGREMIRAAMRAAARPAGHGFHYFTTDHIVEISGDDATVRANFLAAESTGKVHLAPGWTLAGGMLSGSIALTMTGRYESELRRFQGRWLLTVHRVKQNLSHA